MAEGRGSAIKFVGLLAMTVCFINCNVAESASYVVGGNSGWTFNMVGWPSGKHFRAGDVLVFNYSPSAHNVVPVNAAGYTSCAAPRGARAFSSGKDSIALKRGANYFICTFVGHCQAGMKIAVTAA